MYRNDTETADINPLFVMQKAQHFVICVNPFKSREKRKKSHRNIRNDTLFIRSVLNGKYAKNMALEMSFFIRKRGTFAEKGVFSI